MRARLVATVLLLVACARGEQAGDDAAVLRLALPALLDSAGVPAASIALVSEQGTDWAAGFGGADENTIFEAASLGKPVLAYAALRLVDRGLLELDAPLSRYAPYPDLPNDPRSRLITARMVLTHTSGLQNERIGDDTLRLLFDPGSRFGYSGEGFAYLARVLVHLAGVPLQEVVAHEVFGPLGMTRSSYVWRADFDRNAAIGHDGYGQAMRPNRPADARPSTLLTTASDYARFIQAAMTGRGISDSLSQAMRRPHVSVADGVAWGLGWAIEAGPRDTSIWHHGDNSNTGFTAFAIWYPRQRKGLVYFANSTAGLGMVGRVLSLTDAESAASHPLVSWIGYEAHDAPTRAIRMQIERRLRLDGAAAGLALYDQLKRSHPPSLFPEPLLNSLGYRLLSLDRAADAVAVFEANARQFPRSANVYDSLGDGYLAAGDCASALKSYRKSVALDPGNTHAAELIRRLMAADMEQCAAHDAGSPSTEKVAGSTDTPPAM